MSTTRDTSRPVGRPNPPQDYPSDLEMKRMDAIQALQRYRAERDKQKARAHDEV